MLSIFAALRLHAGRCGATVCSPLIQSESLEICPVRIHASLHSTRPQMDYSRFAGSGYRCGMCRSCDHTSILAAHLSELIKRNAHDLLTRQETKRLVDRLSDSHPKLVDELIPKLMTLGEVQKVLSSCSGNRSRSRSGYDPRNSGRNGRDDKNPVILVEAARHTLGRALIRRFLMRVTSEGRHARKLD